MGHSDVEKELELDAQPEVGSGSVMTREGVCAQWVQLQVPLRNTDCE